MNIRTNLLALSLALSVSLAGVASAMPPRTHSIQGEVIAVSPETDTFIIRDERTRAETAIRWKPYSRFVTADGRAGACCLSTGLVAKVSFRREIGGKVARQVRWPRSACQ